MNWFIVVYFLISGAWVEADKLNKEGWSPIIQSKYKIFIEKINESNNRFIKIAEYRNVEVDIMFKCECRINIEQPNEINCKPRNWFQKILDEIIKAQPTDGLWDDGRTDVGQLGLTYQEVEEAMSNLNSKNRSKYEEIRKLNLHKMQSIPVCKIPK